MAKTRILQIIPSLAVGGAERMLYQLVTHLDRDRYDVSVVSFHQLGSSIERDFARSGVEVDYLGKRLGLDVRTFWRVAAAIRRARPDLVHTHRPVLQYALPALSRWLPGRVVHTVHSVADREIDGRARKACHWVAYRLGVAPIAICGAVADSIRRVYGVAPRAIIPNGIPVSEFAVPAAREPWRAKNGIPEGAVVFTFVGRLAPQKNPYGLLRAFAAAGGPGQRRLLVAGDGELRAPMEAEARKLGIDAQVVFLGVRQDVPEILAASDVFVLSSAWEGHPLCVMEAMAAGRPVVATAVGGVPEIVQDGVEGLLVPAGDPAALAAALRRMEGEPELRERLGRQAAARAAADFDVSRMTAAYDRLYQEILSGRDR